MKFLKHLIPLLTLLVLMSCEKFKLEEDTRGNLLLGKWKYDYSGYHTSSIDFVRTINPYEDFEIEFLEGGKFCIIKDGVSEEFRIRDFGNGNTFTVALWVNYLRYGKTGTGEYFDIHYYSEDSIMLTKFPHETPYAPSQYNGLNVFKRIE